MEEGCTRRDGRTDPYYPTCKLRPSNRIDVKDLRRVVLPPVFDFGLSFFPFPSRARERERERESSSTPSFRSTFARKHTTLVGRKLFEKSSRCILDDIPAGPPSILFQLCSAPTPTLSVLSPPDLNQIAGMIYGDVKQTRPIPLLLFLLLDTQILIILDRGKERKSSTIIAKQEEEIYIYISPLLEFS